MSGLNFDELSLDLLIYFDEKCLDICDSYCDLLLLLSTAYNLISSSQPITNDFKIALAYTQAVKDRSWEILNTGSWSDVPFRIRNIYTSACFIKMICTLKIQEGTTLEVLKKALSTIDSGLLLGAGMDVQFKAAAKKLSILIYEEEVKELEINFDKIEFSFINMPIDWCFSGIKGSPIEILDRPSLQTFSQYFFQRIPAKISNCLSHWAALKHWQHAGYLIKSAGSRKVPIEVGGQYTANNWGMRLTTLRDFVIEHVISSNSGKREASSSQQGSAYLAQHALFDQVEELRKDIEVPDYCCVSEMDEKNTQQVDINAWFGPSSTVSPLHTDPKHNLLCQVVGRKRVLLYSPEDSPNLYPYTNKIMHNTAQVDPENPDFRRFPKFTYARAIECHLFPGDMLYIPPKWWHHVRALDVSFSVSFWWQ